jgi:competence protein ComGE
MLLKNNGFILAELLLSLSALLMICLFFTPILIDLSKQSKKLQIEKQAHQLLFEELQSFIINDQPSQDHSTVQNGIAYQILWSSTDIPEQRKVCVKIDKNSFQPEIELCRFTE